MITLHIFTEELSAKNVFEKILPEILPENTIFKIYPHQGKQDLEKAIKKTVPSISKTPGARILITRDQDSGDCKEIKQSIKTLLSNNCFCPYLIRIVCKELESWFLGDLQAIEKAYPRFKSENHAHKVEFRDVDQITSPNQKLLNIIPEYTGMDNLPKLEVSQNISEYLDIKNNTSTSFRQTLNGIKKLLDIQTN